MSKLANHWAEPGKNRASLNTVQRRRVAATFKATDELLGQTVAGRLPRLPPLAPARSGLVGLLTELAT